LFGIEEQLKDEKGEFLRKIEGGSEPEVKFSNLENESSILSSSDDNDLLNDDSLGSEEPEEEIDLSQIKGFLGECSSSSQGDKENELDVAF